MIGVCLLVVVQQRHVEVLGHYQLMLVRGIAYAPVGIDAVYLLIVDGHLVCDGSSLYDVQGVAMQSRVFIVGGKVANQRFQAAPQPTIMRLVLWLHVGQIECLLVLLYRALAVGRGTEMSTREATVPIVIQYRRYGYLRVSLEVVVAVGTR